MRLTLFIVVLFLIAGCTPKKQVVTEIKSKDGNVIAFNSCGTGDTTLLFVHGWCINKEYWKLQEEYFCGAGKNYHVVTIDLPGFGASGKNRTEWTIRKYGEDVADVIDALQLNNVVLIGHSMSGNIILEAADVHPKDVIATIGIDNFQETGVILTEDQTKEVNQFFDTLSRNFPAVNEEFAKQQLFQPATDSVVRKRVINDFRSADPLVAVPVLRNLAFSGAREAELLNKATLPLVLVNSSALNTKEESLKKNCKSSYRLLTVGPTGHYPMIENPTLFNTQLQRAITGKE